MRRKSHNQLKSYFISHQVLTSCIAIIFILCGLCVLSLAFYNANDIYKHLNRKAGVVSYWERTGGKYNTATMNIKTKYNKLSSPHLLAIYGYSKLYI